MSTDTAGPSKLTPDSDRLPESLPVPRRRGTRCACGAKEHLKEYGEYGMICPPCIRRRGTPRARP